MPAGIDTWLAGSHAPSRSGSITQNPGDFLAGHHDAGARVRVSSHSRGSGRRSKLSSALPHWPSRRCVSHLVNAEAVLTSLDLGSSAIYWRVRSARARSPNDRTLARERECTIERPSLWSAPAH